MSKKKVENPNRRSFFTALGKEIGDFLREVRQEPDTPPPAQEQKLENIEEQLQSLEETVKQIGEQETLDRQMLVDTLQRLESFQEAVVKRFDALERQLTPQEVSRWQAVFKRLKDIFLFAAGGVTINALYAALVQDETLKARVQELDSGIDQVLEQLTPPSPLPEPALPEPTVTSTASFEPELILIPAGEFLMGTDPTEDEIFVEAKKTYKDNISIIESLNGELPQHSIYVPDYYIAKTPVTNAQYRAFVRATSYQTQAEKTGSGWGWKNSQWTLVEGANWQHPTGPGSDISQKSNHPVVQVSWDDVVSYCEWLAKVTGRPYRLPTEAEWEKAARGPGGLIYPWGNVWDAKRCNNYVNGPKDTTPVGAYPNGASPYSVLDMAGNVWEWCATKWQKPYPYDAEEDEWNAQYLASGGGRGLRGGSWDSAVEYYFRCAFRGWLTDVNWRSAGRGCRVAVSPS